MLSCAGENKNFVESNVVQFSPTQTPQQIYRDESGNLINENGWEIPNFKMKDKHRSSKSVETKNGRKVEIYKTTFQPENKILIEEPFISMGLRHLGLRKIKSVTEFSGKDQLPYCYQFVSQREERDGSNSTLMLFHHMLCDANGDGIFETVSENGFSFPVPDWVK